MNNLELLSDRELDVILNAHDGWENGTSYGGTSLPVFKTGTRIPVLRSDNDRRSLKRWFGSERRKPN